MIGENIKEMVIKTSNECFPLLKGKIDEFFNAIMKIRVDSLPLKSQIEKYMISVDCFDVVQRANSTKLSFEVQNERLAIVASQIADALNFESVEVRRHQSLNIDFVTLDTK